MLMVLQIAAATIFVAAMLKVGGIVSDSLEEALGEKRLRERSADEAWDGEVPRSTDDATAPFSRPVSPV
jgi:hypothetical protein